jgi:hypothetical protein
LLCENSSSGESSWHTEWGTRLAGSAGDQGADLRPGQNEPKYIADTFASSKVAAGACQASAHLLNPSIRFPIMLGEMSLAGQPGVPPSRGQQNRTRVHRYARLADALSTVSVRGFSLCFGLVSEGPLVFTCAPGPKGNTFPAAREERCALTSDFLMRLILAPVIRLRA